MSRAQLIPAALLCLLPLFPPETRGESLGGCAVLIALFAILVWWSRLDALRAVPLLLIAALAFPLSLISQAPGATVEPLATIFLGVAAGLCASSLPKDSRSSSMLPFLLSAAAAVVALHALYQRLWGLDNLIATLEDGLAVADRELLLERAATGRAYANFATPAALGGYLVLVLPITLACAYSRRGALRWVLAGCALLQLAGLAAASSVSAVAAILGALVLGFLKGRARPRTLAAFGMLGLLLVAVLSLRGREVIDLSDRRSPWRLRAANFRLAGLMIADHPWTGAGAGAFGEVYPRYRRRGDNETRHVHNLPLESAAELGAPGGILVSGLFFFLFAGPLFRKKVESPSWWRGVELGLAAFALHNLADFTAYMPSLLWSAAALRGWIARREAPARSLNWRAPVGAAVAVTIFVAGVAVLAGLGRNARDAARQAAVEKDRGEAERQARRAVTIAPWSTDGWLLAAQATVDGGPGEERLERAAADVERAVRLSPVRPAARALRSRLRAARGDLPGAYADAVQASALYPGNAEYAAARDALASRFKRSGRGEAAP